MKLKAIAIGLLMSCTARDRSTQTLLDQGFTNVTIVGHSWQCGRDDSYCTEFEATGPSGRHVRGAVGCGMGCGKGCTIRVTQ